MVTEIGISVDAAEEPTYKLNRGGSWKRLWENIEFINRLQSRDKKLILGLYFTVQDNNFKEIIPFVHLAIKHRVSWISLTALRNWGTYTEEDYQRRAVHLPEHPNHQKFKRVISILSSAKNPRIVMEQIFTSAHRDRGIRETRTTATDAATGPGEPIPG